MMTSRERRAELQRLMQTITTGEDPIEITESGVVVEGPPTRPNLIARIFHEMETDGDADDDMADELAYWYQRASEDQQKAIDRVFISMCGWSLRSLIYGEEASRDYHPFRDANGEYLR